MGFGEYITEPFRLFVTLTIIPMIIFIISISVNIETIQHVQTIGIIYEIFGFIFLLVSTSSSYLFQMKIKIPKENYGIAHPKMFKLGAMLVIIGLLYQLSDSVRIQ